LHIQICYYEYAKRILKMASLYIRDAGVAALADKLQKAMRAPSKTEAVRRALKQALANVDNEKSIDELLAPALAAADKLGPARPGFDYKAFKDELSET
jgi:antitoxin VapB